jgi:hypothetical protein
MVLAFVGGSGIFLAFLIVFLLAVIYGLFTVKGSAISQRPYGNVYGGAPGARTRSRMSDRDGGDIAWMRPRRTRRR